MAKTPAPPLADSAEETAYIFCMLTKLTPDRTQYKPYGIELTPHRVMVKIPVDSEEYEVVMKRTAEGEETDEPDYVILSLKGMTDVVAQVVGSIDTMHNKHLENLRKGVR